MCSRQRYTGLCNNIALLFHPRRRLLFSFNFVFENFMESSASNCGFFKFSSVLPLWTALDWLPVLCRTQFKVLVWTFKALHSETPLSISGLFSPHQDPETEGLMKTKGSEPLQSLPIPALESFKEQLKTQLNRLFFFLVTVPIIYFCLTLF